MKTIFTFCFLLLIAIASQAQIQIDMQKAMAYDKDGLTLLHRTNNIDTLKYLLEHGADPNTISQIETRINSYDGSTFTLGGDTPLMICSNYNKAKYLLEHGADPNRKSAGGLQQSVLYHAMSSAQYGGDSYLAICKLLLERGANPNALEVNGFYPLSFISGTSKGYAVMKLLLDYGANPNLQSKFGYTPLMSLTDGLSVIFEKEHDCTKNEEYKSLFNLFKLLLEYRANPNIQKDYGEYPLLEIIKWHNYEYKNDADTTLIPTLRLFVAYGANPNLVTTTFHTSCLNEANKPERAFLKKYAGAHRSFDPFYANLAVGAVQSFNQGVSQPNTGTTNTASPEQLATTGTKANSTNGNAASQQQCTKETEEQWKETPECKKCNNGVPPTMLHCEQAKLILVEMMLKNCRSLMSAEDIKTDEDLVKRLKNEITSMQQQWDNSNKIGK
ncbi:MAG TPA: ankyrin repeat domain-containing protein [Cytophagaceae bacterium]|jgi:ankyrin repeat protein|nr:ankyrin repeat domain-containing protein [Cytophagaceae bacterium]